ncbi:MAG: GNAT family N-acetyltransferase [Myxococcota bacterium]
MYLVRPATPADLQRLVVFGMANRAHHAAVDPGLVRASIAELRHRYAAMLDHARARVFVAEAAGELVGMTAGRVEDHVGLEHVRCGNVDEVWVEAAHRRRGVARGLLGELTAFFAAQQVSRVVLQYVPGNALGEDTWRALGFQPCYVTARTDLGALRRRLSR